MALGRKLPGVFALCSDLYLYGGPSWTHRKPSPSGEGRLVGLVQLVRNSPYGQP